MRLRAIRLVVAALLCIAPLGAAAAVPFLGNVARTPETPDRQKIASVLREHADLVRSRVTAGQTARLSAMSTPLVRVHDTGEMQVYVIVTDASSANVAHLERLGLAVEVVLVDHGLVQGWVPADALDLIAALDFVKEI